MAIRNCRPPRKELKAFRFKKLQHNFIVDSDKNSSLHVKLFKDFLL